MNLVKQSFIYYGLAAIFGGLLLICYIQGDTILTKAFDTAIKRLNRFLK